MTGTEPEQSSTTRLAHRLADAARSATSSRRASAPRCAAPVAVDAWETVSERCPLPQHHDDEHEIESENARRHRLERAAALQPGEVLVAAQAVTAWLARSGAAGAAAAITEAPAAVLPARELWLLGDVAEACALLDQPELAATRDAPEVRSDG